MLEPSTNYKKTKWVPITSKLKTVVLSNFFIQYSRTIIYNFAKASFVDGKLIGLGGFNLKEK